MSGKSGKHTGKGAFARLVTDGVLDGKPDMYNYVAKRIVEKEESEKMGWNHFFDGKSVCPAGHVAARYTRSPSTCVDCRRLAANKPTIYAKHEFVDDLTTPPALLDPVASDTFDWTPEIRRQFFNAMINLTSVSGALRVIKAQPVHLINIRETDAEFQAEYEAAERKRDMVLGWTLEGEAADGSDRLKLAVAANKFAAFGAKTGLVGRPPANAEESRARSAQLLSRIDQSLSQQERLERVAEDRVKLAQAVTAGTGSGTAGLGESSVVGPSHDAGEVVSDSEDSSGVSEADAPYEGGIEL